MTGSDGRLQIHERLVAGPAGVRQARGLVRRQLLEVGRSDLVDTGELLASELVTNALLHVGTWVDLDVVASSECLQVNVSDASPELPRVSAYSLSAGTGRGLRMVQSLADSWGAEPTAAGGKTVWFRVSSNHENLEPAARRTVGCSTVEDQPASLTVRLLNVPLLLHWAWQEHASAVLRDHLLASMGTHDPVTAIENHAVAAEALSILERAIPVPELPERSEELLGAAIEPAVTAAEINVVLPVSSVASFARLDRSLDEALAQDDWGALLTARMQPELRELRRWLCQEVREQANARAPRPWEPPDESSTESSPPEWDSSAVRNSASAIIAADDTDRIVVVSAAAARMLGYPDPESMAGRRLVSIIPNRFRQAHLAGFTMYLHTGRAPLLAGPVEVPALRYDGSETVVVLSLESHAVDNGRTVFTARLTAPTRQQPFRSAHE